MGKTDHEIFPKEMTCAIRANDLEALETEAPLRFKQLFPHEDEEYSYYEAKNPPSATLTGTWRLCRGPSFTSLA